MAREYTAFISYRHCPLDIAVAETLHKHIERFHVPKDLRINGQKNLGVVFRDRDELPLSNNLTESICEALDHAKFLIVVCTPETPKSIWVEREIEYFIQKHGRERILTVLAAGTPEESIPKIITNIYAPDGRTVVDRVEPLCAFLVDEDERKVLKNLNKEFLRLVAAILGCHYDALVQRQKRYRAQMISYAVGILAVVALLFVGMLVNRNREITAKSREIEQKNQEIEQKKQELEEQLRQTQINESQALTLLSKQQLAEGNRLGAIKSALNALPHDGDNRPYSAAAEGALADALNIYKDMLLDYYLTIEQPLAVRQLTLSDDGRYLVTVDTTNCLRCFDTSSTAMLWEYRFEGVNEYLTLDGYETAKPEIEGFAIEILEIIEKLDLVLYSDPYTTYAISLKTGEILNSVSFWAERQNVYYLNFNTIALSPDETVFIQLSKCDKGNHKEEHYLEVYRTDTFELIYSHSLDWNGNWDVLWPPAFSLDNSRLAALLSASRYDMELVVLDTVTWDTVYQKTITVGEKQFVSIGNAHLAWMPNNELLIYYEQPKTDTSINAYFIKLDEDWESTQVGPYNIKYARDTQNIKITHYLTETHIYYNIKNVCVFALELDTLQRTSYESCNLAGSYLRKNGDLMLATASGEIGRITSKGGLGFYWSVYQYDQNTTVAAGVAGEKETLCLVPENAPNTVVIVSEPMDNHEVVLESPTLAEYGSLFHNPYAMEYALFPSRKAFLTIDGITIDGTKKAVTIYDALSLEPTDSFIIEGEECIFLGFSADETKLLFDSLIYDISTHTQSEYENGREIYSKKAGTVHTPARYSQLPGTPLFTACEGTDTLYWWVDGGHLKSYAIPHDIQKWWDDCIYTSYSQISRLGGSGLYVKPLFSDFFSERTNAYSIFSAETEEWHLLLNPVDRNGFPVLSIGNTERVVAFADFDGMLRVYDFDLDSITHQWLLTVSPDSITRMQYLAEDQYLLIYTETDNVHLIDMHSGLELGSYYLDYIGTSYLTSVYTNDGVAYLFGLNETLRIDLTTGSVLATIPYMRCYLPGTNRAIRADIRSELLTAIPIYTWEELAQKGWELIRNVEENRIS